MNDRLEVCNLRSGGLEDGETDEWLRGDIDFEDGKPCEADDADEKRSQCSPTIPRVHHAAPGYRNEERCKGSNEKESTNPVDTLELSHERRWAELESQEVPHHGKTNANELRLVSTWKFGKEG